MRSKVIFITGVSSGIGLALATHFTSKGYRVIGSMRKPLEKGHSLYNEPNFKSLLLDVAKEDSVTIIQDQIEPMLAGGELVALVNNAGIAVGGPLELVSEEEFVYQMQVNVFGVRRITNALLPYLKEGKGRVINIGSISGKFTTPYLGPYCISKYSLEAMSDAYRRELAQWGIKVILIEPGPINTPIWAKSKGMASQYESSPYAFHMKKADKLIANSEAQAQPVTAVVNVVWKACTVIKPKVRYLVMKNGWFFKLLLLLPDSLIDQRIFKAFERNRKNLA